MASIDIICQNLGVDHICDNDGWSDTDYLSNISKIISASPRAVGYKFHLNSQRPNLFKSFVKKLNDDGCTDVTVYNGLEVRIDIGSGTFCPSIIDIWADNWATDNIYKIYRFMVDDDRNGSYKLSKAKCIYDGN